MTHDPTPIGSFPVTEDDLQAWIDVRLPSGRQRDIEAWLEANPEAAARCRAMAAEREALRAALRPSHDAPIPARLRVAHIQAQQDHARAQGWRRTAAVLAWVMLGAGLGWAGHGLVPAGAPRPVVAQARPRPMVAEAIAAHLVFVADARRPVEVAAQQEDLLLRWLSNRLSRPVSTPNLAAQGYRLMGGRLLPGAGGDPAAQLMYEDAAGARLTLYLRADRAEEGETAFRFTDDAVGGVSGFWWVDRGFGYAVLAQGIDRPALLGLAEAVHRQVLTTPTAPNGRPAPNL